MKRKHIQELLTYKQEALTVLCLSIILMVYRWASIRFLSVECDPSTYPQQYDLRSQVETIFWVITKCVVYVLAAWLALRVVLPKGYAWLKNEVYLKFDAMTDGEKTNISQRTFAMILLALALLAMAGCTPANAQNVRSLVVASASADVGVREATGHNDGPAVERYLAHVGLSKGSPWCAAFVSYHLSKEGVRNPMSGWSPAFAVAKDRVWTPRKASRAPMPGDVFSLYFSNLGRVGHVGFVTGYHGQWITTVEGNTSGPGSREGDGVYARRRELNKVYAITDYIHDDGGATGAALPKRMQGQAGHYYQHRYAQRYAHLGDPTRHLDTRATRSGIPIIALAGARTGRSRADQAKGPRRQYAQREQGRGAGRMPVRHREYRSAAVRHVDERAPGHHDHFQRGGREVPDTRMGLVASGRSCGLHRPTPAAGLHQTVLTLR